MIKSNFFTRFSGLLMAALILTSCAAGSSVAAPTPDQPTPVVADETMATAVPLTPTPPPSSTAPPMETVVPVPSPTPTTAVVEPTMTAAPVEVSVPILPAEGAIVVDHTSVTLFEQIPAEYLQAAANLRMVYVDRSVGANISEGLNCLSQPVEDAPHYCRVWEHKGDPAFSVDPSEVSWSGTYDRRNWVYLFWPNNDPKVPDIACNVSASQWFNKGLCFEEFATSQMDNYDVLSFQFSYLAVDAGSNITAVPGGFFSDTPNRYDVYDFAQFEATHPDKTFIYWTTSLARSIGTTEAESFNAQMRDYALSNGRVLFDVADILSHDPNGNPCYDNRDGIFYNDGNQSENYPDDGLNLPAICPHYATEVDGGHLGSTSAGMIRVAKAFWVLMAQIAGWRY